MSGCFWTENRTSALSGFTYFWRLHAALRISCDSLCDDNGLLCWTFSRNVTQPDFWVCLLVWLLSLVVSNETTPWPQTEVWKRFKIIYCMCADKVIRKGKARLNSFLQRWISWINPHFIMVIDLGTVRRILNGIADPHLAVGRKSEIERAWWGTITPTGKQRLHDELTWFGGIVHEKGKRCCWRGPRKTVVPGPQQEPQRVLQSPRFLLWQAAMITR